MPATPRFPTDHEPTIAVHHPRPGRARQLGRGVLRRARRLPQARSDAPVARRGLDHAAGHGAAALEGYPVEAGDGRVDAISGYVGTVGLFERAGFTPVVRSAGRSGGRPRWVMRRQFHS